MTRQCTDDHCATSSVYFAPSTLSGLHMECFLSHPAYSFFNLACCSSDDSIIGNFNSIAKNSLTKSSAFPPDVLSPHTARLYLVGFWIYAEILGLLKRPSRKTCISCEKECLYPRIYQVKFCLAVFLWSQPNIYYIFTRNRWWNAGEYISKGLITKAL